MKKENKKSLVAAIYVLLAFILWTLSVKFVDVKGIGAQGSAVGFATLNGFFRDLIGVNMPLYIITDWLGLVPIATALGFALFGLIQLVKNKSIKKVDYSLFVLGGFYIAVMTVFFFFETVVINYRPVLIEGVLEASYPSSTTMLVMTVMPTAIIELNSRVKSKALKTAISLSLCVFVLFMVVGRILSGVHWITDIIGGALISTSLVLLYRYTVKLKAKQ